MTSILHRNLQQMFIEPVIGDNDDEQPTEFRDSLEPPQDQLNKPLDFMGFP